ncbi:Cwf15/Cwc15 cell cycle control protein [Acrodontium crateriforme]|uniref:Cwf15/Cwc15 cell cycle control protein n=1 Tax=Acrodontium crateriforme TaxID=150365 RepID=A0AAQ3M7W5_9PEZI|nr:Cwf15/Cwc15 cell cycle control protein [Acrodontium crateriforme]
MTTAHRPTFDPARGKEAARGEAYHQRLLPAHKILKFRQANQGTPDEQARRNLRAELLQAEAKHYGKSRDNDEEDEDTSMAERQTLQIEEGNESNSSAKRKLEEPGSDMNAAKGDTEEEDYEAKKRRILEETHAIDASSDSSSSESESDSDDEEEDETAELMRELAKIKAERAEAAAKQAAEQAKRDEEQREKDIALGNPLLNKTDYGVKRRWDDDVVFKNQARGTEERGKDKKFVNDLLRSDFHRKFMDKYVR